MKPVPTLNPDEFGLPEDTLVADPMSIDLEDLWNGTAQRNRAIFAELFRTVPSDSVRNFEQYKVRSNGRLLPHVLTRQCRPMYQSPESATSLLASHWNV